MAVMAAVIMASMSGSAAADSAALAAILIPMMRDAGYNVPRAAGLMAAGGIVDGRGVAAAFMLGAEGVWIGSAFLASEEARHVTGTELWIDGAESLIGLRG